MKRVLRAWVNRALVLVLVGVIPALAPAGRASSTVFESQNQALRDSFPQATRIERDTHVLRASEVEQLKSMLGGEVESKLVVIHTAFEGDQVVGYAHIDVHNVRTQPEAFMVVLSPEGIVRSVRILAFHEPLDYLPTDRWYTQFIGKSRADDLRVGRDIHGVVGATLSARAATEGVRRMIAYWEVLLRPDDIEEPADKGN